MKKIRSGLVLLLSLMVFITSSGMAVNLHYCAGQLQNVSLSAKADDCGMQKTVSKKACDADTKTASIKKADTCCQNKHIAAKTDTKVNPAKKKDESGPSKTFTFINHYITSLIGAGSSDEKKEEDDAGISVFPLLKQGLYILLQQFRN